MTRQLGHPVSFVQDGVPILVPAGKAEPYDGIRNFYWIETHRDEHGHGGHSDQQRIREVTDADVDSAEQILGPARFQELLGALNLRQGFEVDDETLRKKGFERLGHGNFFTSFIAQNKRWAGLEFPLTVSKFISAVRLVMWFSPARQRFLPAFDCPDLATGIIVKSLIDIRSCPKCSKLFTPRASNVYYCSVKCRDAYRLWRAREREKIKMQEKAGKKAGRKRHGKR
jgi:hypothetical protein